MFRYYRNLSPGTGKPRIYLTFDDGPDPDCTPEVLKILERLAVRATFFVIANKAQANRALFSEIAKKHAIGNHSLDHSFRPFFATRKTLLEWIEKSERIFREELHVRPVAFRAPAGVRTPPLYWALRKLDLPLVHWNRRFYDTRFAWTEKKALRSLARTTDGSIILLHDTHRGERKSLFLKTLVSYIEGAVAQGFQFEVLDEQTISRGT